MGRYIYLQRHVDVTLTSVAKLVEKSKWNMVETRLPYGPVNVILQLK